MSEERDRGATSSGVERMGSFAAVLWTVGVWIVFFGLVLSIVPGAGIQFYVGTGFVQLGVYLGGVLLIRRTYMREMPLRSAIALRRPPVLLCLLALIIGVTAQVWIQVLFEFIIARVPLPDSADQAGIEGQVTPVLLGLRIAQLVFFIPLAEELLFRGGLMRPLLVKRTWIEPLVITSLLFCMVHMRWQFAVPLLPLALCLGGLRIVSGSLVPSLLLHMAYNSAALVMGMVPNFNRLISWPVFLGSIALSIACAAGAFIIGRPNAVASRNRALDA